MLAILPFQLVKAARDSEHSGQARRILERYSRSNAQCGCFENKNPDKDKTDDCHLDMVTFLVKNAGLSCKKDHGQPIGIGNCSKEDNLAACCPKTCCEFSATLGLDGQGCSAKENKGPAVKKTDTCHEDQVKGMEKGDFISCNPDDGRKIGLGECQGNLNDCCAKTCCEKSLKESLKEQGGDTFTCEEVTEPNVVVHDQSEVVSYEANIYSHAGPLHEPLLAFRTLQGEPPSTSQEEEPPSTSWENESPTTTSNKADDMSELKPELNIAMRVCEKVQEYLDSMRKGPKKMKKKREQYIQDKGQSLCETTAVFEENNGEMVRINKHGDVIQVNVDGKSGEQEDGDKTTANDFTVLDLAQKEYKNGCTWETGTGNALGTCTYTKK